MAEKIEIARHTTTYATAMAELNYMHLESIRDIHLQSSQNLLQGIPQDRTVEVKANFHNFSDLSQAKSVLTSGRVFSEQHPYIIEHDALEASIGALIRIGEDIDSGEINRSLELWKIGKVVKDVGLVALNHLIKTPVSIRPEVEGARKQTLILLPLLGRKDKKRWQPFAEGRA